MDVNYVSNYEDEILVKQIFFMSMTNVSDNKGDKRADIAQTTSNVPCAASLEEDIDECNI